MGDGGGSIISISSTVILVRLLIKFTDAMFGIWHRGVISQNIMAATSQYLKKAYDKISKWLTVELRQMGKDTRLEVGKLMRESMQRLGKRKQLLTYVSFSSLSPTI